jgi:inhibitor of cysteine peptidase
MALAGAILLVTACAKSHKTALTESDAGRSIVASVGDELTVRLPANATTGFRWVISEIGPLEQLGEPIYDGPKKPGLVGAGGVETFRFKAADSGSGELKLEYRRPWEKGAPPEKAWSVKVSVN